MTSPFDDLRSLVSDFPEADDEARQAYYATLKTKPFWDYGGGLPDLMAWLAAWQGNALPKAKDVHLCLLASSYSHGSDPELVLAEISRTSKGRAAVNPFCVRSGLGLRVLELGPQIPHTVDPKAPNWEEKDVMATVAFGMEATAAGGDILGLAGLAPGDEQTGKAILAALMQSDFETPSIFTSQPGDADPLQVLLSVGGREIAGLLGGLIAARSRRIPVLIEGWAALGAAAILKALSPAGLDHVRLASLTDEAQRDASKAVGFQPIVGPLTGFGPGVGLALASDTVVSGLSLAGIPDVAAPTVSTS